MNSNHSIIQGEANAKGASSTKSISPPSICTLTLPNGAIYKGSVNAETQKPEGQGVLLYANKEKYEGQFKNGMKHGKGKYYYNNGALYIGDWYQNKKHGNGKYFYEDGKIYNGAFGNNMKHGQGRIEEVDGSYYQGKFYENEKHGAGQYYEAGEDKKYLIVYDKGKQVSCRQIIQIPNMDRKSDLAINMLDIFRNNHNQRLDIASEENVLVRDFANQYKNKQNYISQCEPLFESQQISNRKKKSVRESESEIEVTNFFDKKLIQKRIFSWGVQEVSEWLKQIGFGDCINDFKENNIMGDTLLTLDLRDLKKLNVAALGDRKILMRQIQFLKLIFKTQCVGDRISKLMHMDLTFKMIKGLQENADGKLKQEPLEDLSSEESSQSDRESRSKIPIKKSKATMNMKRKFQIYMEKKGINLTFIIPKQQIEIIKPIGKGGYGQVYLGRWLGQDVAVKKYTKKQGFRNRHVGNFIQEVQVITKLLHPNIVLYMGMCVYDSEYAMVTEYLSEGSLFDYLHKRGEILTQQKIFDICKDMALGMSYLHGRNVLHCDLKSSNVLIDENWNIKICDFGLSRIRNAKKYKENNIRVGTPHWMAPEILKGEKYECESDVYSFGVILWEMLMRQIPYHNKSTAEIITLVGNNEQYHLPVPKYPNSVFVQLILKCTDREIKKRPTFKEIVQLLQAQDSSENQAKPTK